MQQPLWALHQISICFHEIRKAAFSRILSKRMANGESTKGDWLVWSESVKELSCFSCCLFNVKPPPRAFSAFSHAEASYKDNWKKLHEKAKSHEQSSVHVANSWKWKDLVSSNKQSGVDAMHQQSILKETNRWRHILRCLLDVTLFLAERNLPFRGSSAVVGHLAPSCFSKR